MSRADRIKKKVEATLNLMGTEERLKADPYFFTRLQAEITAAQELRLSAGPLSARWRPWVLAALAGVNIIFAALWTVRTTETQRKETALTYLARDYGMTAEAGDWLHDTIGD